MKSGAKIIVTGASGFIGSHIARRLAEAGHNVTGIYNRRQPEYVSGSFGKIDFLKADLIRPENIEKELRTADAVVHAAAKVGDWGPAHEFDGMNNLAVRRLADLSKENGVRKFVFLSSVTVHGFGPHVDTTEDGPYYPPVSDYQKSKIKAEEYLKTAHTGAFGIVILRPGNVYGPGDTTMSFPFFDAMRKGIMGYIKRGSTLTCPLFIDDLAEAVLHSLEAEFEECEVFNITGGEKVTWKEFLTRAAVLLDCRSPRLSVPPRLASFLAVLGTFLYKFLGKKTAPPLTMHRADQLSHDFHFSIGKAEKLLGFKPRVRYEEGLEPTVRDYLSRLQDRAGLQT